LAVTVGFIILAVLSFAAAVGVVAARTPVHSALSLIANVITLAVLYLMLNAEFMAAAQVIVYAGAIMVLFLFVVTLLTAGKEERERPEQLPAQRALSGFLAVAAGVLLAGVALRYGAGGTVTQFSSGYGSLPAMGRLLWGPGFDYLAVVALMLLAAALAVLVLNRPVDERPPRRPAARPAAEEERP
jgi:NADH-quinone oxidoreductase subunit J